MRLMLTMAVAMIAFTFVVTDTKPAHAQVIVCAGYQHGIPYGCRPRHPRPYYRGHASYSSLQTRHWERHTRRVVHQRRIVYRGTVMVPRGPGIVPRAPAWTPGIPPGNGQTTRVSEFDGDGQAYCTKYAPGTRFIMWVGGSGMARKARCG